jgi:hypothetical protein
MQVASFPEEHDWPVLFIRIFVGRMTMIPANIFGCRFVQHYNLTNISIFFPKASHHVCQEHGKERLPAANVYHNERLFYVVVARQ